MIVNYSEHKPQLLIYNNVEVVTDGITDRNTTCYVGICKPSFTIANFGARMTPVTALSFDSGEPGTPLKDLPASDFTPVSTFLQGFISSSSVATIEFVDASGETIEEPGITASLKDNVVVLNKSGEITQDVYISFPVSAFDVNFNATGKTISMQLITSSSDITNYLGPVINDPSDANFNSLAFVASLALTAGDGKAFYVDAVKDAAGNSANEVAAYTASFNKLSRTDLFLHLWCDTYNAAVLNLAKSYVIEASQPDVQRWRKCYAATEETLPDAEDSFTDVSDYVISRSKSWGYRGMINVWTPGAYFLSTDNSGITKELPLPNKYVAAGIAALRSSLLPQQGSSKMELAWISSIPESYGATWTESKLDKVAAYGTFLVVQDDDRTTPYIRHQLTTDTSNGVLYWEDNITDVTYTVDYGVKDLFKGYVGRRNITKSLLKELENRLGDYLLGLTYTGSDIESRQIGPLIVSVDLTSIKAVRDPQFMDRVVLSGDYYVATSLNVLKVSLNTYLGM